MSRAEHFCERLHGYSTLPCIDDKDHLYTYAQLLEEVQRWRSRFDELDVRSGDVVGLRADYSLSAAAALLALFLRHSIVALIPANRSTDQYLLDACAAAFLEVNVDGSYEYASVNSSRNHELLDRLRAANEGGVVIFTSGSTGRPKAALQSTERFLYKFQKPGRRFRTLAFLLFDHIAGLDTLFYTFVSGGTLILTRRRDPNAIIDVIQSHSVEVLPASPSFLRLLCAAGDHHGEDLSSLKIITYGSEPMDSSTLARVNRRFPNAQISQKYGTTETGSPRSVSRANDSLWIKIKSDGMDTKVVDNVLWLRSEGTILGYLNAPSPIDEQGWYCTGDLVDVDGEWIRFRGRLADTINVGGEKVAPAEVEQSILELDFVQDAVVSGESHPLMGQIVAAQVVLTALPLDTKEVVRRIRQHCRQRLAQYKVPIKIEVVRDGLVNVRQKIQRTKASD